MVLDKTDFLKLEYESLRIEIKDTKDRIFKFAGIGLIGTPIAYFLSSAYNIEAIILVLPIFICIISLLYISESHALMRCGRYIRTIIEPEVNELNDKGWEEWLEMDVPNERDRRFVDKLVNISFYLLFTLYYIASVLLAGNIAVLTFKNFDILVDIIYGIYGGLGVVFIYFMQTVWRSSTSTK